MVKLLDNGTTYYFISKIGSEAEGNPIVRWSVDTFGLDAALLVNYIMFVIITFLLYKFNGRITLLLIILLLSIVVISNSIASIFIFINT